MELFWRWGLLQHPDWTVACVTQSHLCVFLQVDEYVIQGQSSAQEWDIMFPEQEYIFGEFTERLWAYLTIEQLLDRKSVLFALLLQFFWYSLKETCYTIYIVI